MITFPISALRVTAPRMRTYQEPANSNASHMLGTSGSRKRTPSTHDLRLTSKALRFTQDATAHTATHTNSRVVLSSQEPPASLSMNPSDCPCMSEDVHLIEGVTDAAIGTAASQTSATLLDSARLLGVGSPEQSTLHQGSAGLPLAPPSVKQPVKLTSMKTYHTKTQQDKRLRDENHYLEDMFTGCDAIVAHFDSLYKPLHEKHGVDRAALTVTCEWNGSGKVCGKVLRIDELASHLSVSVAQGGHGLPINSAGAQDIQCHWGNTQCKAGQAKARNYQRHLVEHHVVGATFKKESIKLLGPRYEEDQSDFIEFQTSKRRCTMMRGYRFKLATYLRSRQVSNGMLPQSDPSSAKVPLPAPKIV